MTKRPVARIATLATAVPDLVIDQAEIFDKVFRDLFKEVPSAESIFRNSGIRKRHWFCATTAPRSTTPNSPTSNGRPRTSRRGWATASPRPGPGRLT